jgi:glycosyltransferase involved in cell wall biosynthesis
MSTNPEPLKINIVVGGRFHAAQLYEALTDLGHDVHIYASSPARYFKSVPNNRVTFIPKPSQLLQKGLKRRMPRRLTEWSSAAFDWIVANIMRPADMVWGFNGDSLISGLKVKAAGGVFILDRACPHILTQAALLKKESELTRYSYLPLTKRLKARFVSEYDVADIIVVPSEYSASSFLSRGFSPEKVLKAPLDANAPKPSGNFSSRKELDGCSQEKFCVGMVGGSFLRKGIIYLLRAVAALDRPDIQLLIRTTPSNLTQHDEAKALVEQLGVVFVPYLEDINIFYQSIDCFVLPSVDEGFGMVLYEALMNGTPVIATDHVGAIDGMEPGKDLLKVPIADEQALAEAIKVFADDPVRRKQIGLAGQRFYNSRLAEGGQYSKSLKHIVEQARIEYL